MFNIGTPHKENNGRLLDKSDITVSFGEVDSFVEPAPRDRKRQPLISRSDNPRKANEFTPLLRTATRKNRMMNFETPGQANQTTDSIVENSGLTPVNWQRHQLPIERSKSDSATPSTDTPMQAPNQHDIAGIREQEKAMDKMKKENWELKLKVFLMEKQMQKTAPEHVQLALKENIDYKIQVASLSRDIAKYKKSLTDTERKVADLGNQVSLSMSQECQLEHGTSEQDRRLIAKLEEEHAALQSDLEDAEMKIREMEGADEQVKELEAQLSTIQEQLGQLSATNETVKHLEEQLETIKDEKSTLQDKLHETTDDLTALQSRYDDLLSQTRHDGNDEVVDILRDQLDEKVETIKELTGALRKAEAEKVDLEARLSSTSARLEQSEQENDDLQGQNDMLEAELQSAMTNKDELDLAKYNFDAQNDQLRIELRDFTGRCVKYEEKIQHLVHELAEREEDIQEFRGAADDRSREFRLLEEQLEHRNDSVLQHNNASLYRIEEELSSTKLELRESARQVEIYKNKYVIQERATEQAGQTIKSQVRDLESAKTILLTEQAKSQSLERDCTQLRNKVESLVERSTRLDMQLRESEANNQDPDATQIQERLHEENADLRAQIDDLEMQLRDKEGEIDIATEETSRLNHEIEDLRLNSEGRHTDLEQAQSQLGRMREQLEVAEGQQRTLSDKLIQTENARARLQQELGRSEKLSIERDEKAQALNSSLLNVRAMLAETQSAHRAELQALRKAHDKECQDLAKNASDIETNVQYDLAQKAEALKTSEKRCKDLETRLESCQHQVSDLERSLQRIAESEKTVSGDHARFKETLKDEQERFRAKEQELKRQIQDLEESTRALHSEVATKSSLLKSHEEELRHVKASEATAILDNEQIHARNLELERTASQVQQRLDAIQGEKASLTQRVSVVESSSTSLQDTLSQTRRDHQQQLMLKADEVFTKVQEIRELQDKLLQVENKCTSLEAEKKRLNMALDAADLRLVDSSDRFNTLTIEKEALELSLEQFQGQTRQTHATESEQTKLRKELATTKTALHDLQIEIDELATEKDLVQDQLNSLNEAFAAQSTDHTTALKALRHDLQESRAAFMIETERHNKLERETSLELTTLLNRSEAEQRKLNEQVANLEESLQVAQQQHRDLLASIGQTNDEVTGLRDRLREKDIAIGELNHKIRSAESRRTEAAEVDVLMVELEGELDDVRKTAAKEKARFEEELFELEKERTTLETELLELQHKHDTKCHEQDLLRGELAEQKRAIKTLRSTSTHARDESRVTNQSREHDDLQRQLERARREIDSLRATARSLENTKTHDKQAESRLNLELKDATRKIKVLQSDIHAREKRVNELKAFAKEKSELFEALERRYKQLQSQSQNNQHLTKSSKRHNEEVAGLGKMLQYLRSRTSREESFRADLIYIKAYYDKQITSFEACNQANLAIIRQIGIFPDPTQPHRRPSLKSISLFVLATIRMTRSARTWAKERHDRDTLERAMRNR